MTLKKPKPERHHCGRCGRPLGGAASGTPSQVTKLSKTKKVPERPYAGVLCVNCLGDLLRYKVRFEAKFSKPEEFGKLDLRRDLTLEKFLPRRWYTKLTKKEKK